MSTGLKSKVHFKLKRQEGFTIIEIMIVLAIAAIILIIVLLAIPALQRNAKNTTTKSAAADVVGAVSDYEGQNNEAAPTGFTYASPPTLNFTGGTSDTAQISGSTPITDEHSVATAGTFTGAANNVYISIGFNCGTAAGTTVTQGSTNTSGVAVWYGLATSSGTQMSCLQG